MEGGNKHVINPNAGLDVHSSDMLVSFDQATFQHNWQHYQGKYFANSLRFEKNGWAAGWNVYNFVYNTKRVKLDDIYIGRVKYSNNPGYMLSVYDHEESGDSRKDIFYNDVADTAASGIFRNKPWKYDGVFSGVGLSCIDTLQDDYSVLLKITDDSSKINADFDLWLPSDLTGGYSEKYIGFDGTNHSWGANCKYNVNTGKVTVNGKEVDPEVSGNKLKFNWSENYNEQLSLNLNTKKYYIKFKNCHLGNFTGSAALLDANIPDTDLNKFNCDVTPDELKAGGTIDIIVKAPVWVTFLVQPDTSAVRKPDNISAGNVQVFAVSDTKVFYISAFGSSDMLTLTKGWNNIPVGSRFCKLGLYNTIEPHSSWQPYKYSLNEFGWCPGSYRFSNIRNNIEHIRNMLGNIWNVKDFRFNTVDVLGFTDIESLISDKQNLSAYRSIRMLDDTAVPDTTDDLQYLNDKLCTQSFMSKYGAARTGSGTEYAAAQAAKSYTQLYSNGVYIGGTYTTVQTDLKDSSAFWPFDRIPCFNYRNSSGIVYDRCYAVKDDGTPITSLSAFKSYVLGSYNGDASYAVSPIVAKDWSRKRTVRTYKPGYDFDVEDEEKFNSKWYSWYPDYDSPLSLDVSISDAKYKDYNDIELIEDCNPDIFFVRPGISVGTNVTLDCLNDYDIKLYENDTPDIKRNVWHSAQDKTSLYGFHYDNTPGELYFRGTAYVLPMYFGRSKSNVAVLSEYTGERNKNQLAAKVTSGELSCMFDGMPGAWTKSLLVQFREGNAVASNVAMPDIKQIKPVQLDKSDLSAVKAAIPVYANAGFTIGYPEPVESTDILNYKNAFTTDKISDAHAAEIGGAWVDRDTLPGSISQLTLSIKNIDADNGTGEGYVNMLCKSEGLFYVNNPDSGFFIPGIAYGNVESTAGNMGVSKGSFETVISVSWDSVSNYIPDAGTLAVEPKNSVQHSFYTDGIYMFKSVQVNIGKVSEGMLDISFDIAGEHFIYKYDIETGLCSGDTYTADMYDAEVTFGEPVNTNGAVYVPMLVNISYDDVTAAFAAADGLKSVDGTVCAFDGFSYDYAAMKVIGADAVPVVQSFGDHQHIQFTAAISQLVKVVLRKAYNGVLNGNTVTFEWKNRTYSIDLRLFDNDNTIDVTSVDVRRPDHTKIIGKIKAEDEFQLLRQQWNSTVAVDNFWWVDSKHILELNNEFFVLKRNTGELHDWDGNRFIEVYNIVRGNILDTSIDHYFVPSVYMSDIAAPFVTISLENDSTIKLTVYDILNNMKLKGTAYMQLVRHNIGEKLVQQSVSGNTAYFNTYKELSAGFLLAHAEWSHTVRDNKLIIGCHSSNNLDQWTCVLDLGSFTFEKCILGYGYVGLRGELTGGMLPSDYFDTASGFTGTVNHISSLPKQPKRGDVDAAYYVKDRNAANIVEQTIVGTAERQWYIQKELHGIVSHLTYENGSFTVHSLPITNRYDSVYKSPSFGSSLIGDTFIQPFALRDTFQFESTAAEAIWTTALALIGWPSLFMLNPRLSTLAYLQQTVGQYAYVHYNSSESKPWLDPENAAGNNGMDNMAGFEAHKDGLFGKSYVTGPDVNGKAPVLSEAYTFDKQVFRQDMRLDKSAGSFIAMLFAAFMQPLSIFNEKQSVNEEQNQSAVQDKGRKYCTQVLENIQGLIVNNIITQSVDTGISSKVVAVKSLDMFYSTSDKQRVWAGPGFVEHQFVADCVAQSVTDIQTKGITQQVTFIIRALTELQYRVTVKMAEFTVETLEGIADKQKEIWISAQGMGTGSGSNIGAFLAMAAEVSAKIAYGVSVALIIAGEQMSKFLDVLCANGITSNTTGYVTRHSLTTEGTHKYGEKNEVFMWPCWGTPAEGVKYHDESVNADITESHWQLNLRCRKFFTNELFDGMLIVCHEVQPDLSSFMKPSDKHAGGNVFYNHEGDVPFYQASCYGSVTERSLPADMAKIEGVETFLPGQAFKNENIGMSDPVFAPSLHQDYVIDKQWQLSQYCTYGKQQWVAVKDTKVIDCAPSNMYVNNTFCGIASPYTAVEVKRGISKQYMRPWAVTPNTLAFNCTGYNSILDDKLYHAFDGMSYRIVNLTGDPGLGKNLQSFFYSIQLNDRFKRSNVIFANELQGNFSAEPIQAMNTIDKVWTLMTVAAKEKGLEAGAPGEDKDLVRWSLPIFTEHISTLPAAVKTLTAMPLGVVEGITSLCVQLANNQTAYKAPLSVDFTIGKNVYRVTEEYLCSVNTVNGIDQVTDIIPCLGLVFLGATPFEAYLYSKSTRCYYTFNGSGLAKMDMLERFRSVQKGYWDFVNQEVVMPCLMTYKRLRRDIEDNDTETDNIIVPLLSRGTVSGELPPPLTTLFNDRSWYKCVSLPAGFAYQGPNRVIINRNVFVEYMLDTIKQNMNKWKKLDKEHYNTDRVYPDVYSKVDKDVNGVDGWTYNQFVLVTSALGVDEDADCVFEWNITFCWPIEMDLLYGVDNYACVNIMAETMTPGGKVMSRPTHVYLTKELFTRNGNYGYYNFRYQSKNGAGNRERLHIWSDQYIAISWLICETKMVTARRTEQLVQRLDVQKLKEL